MLDNKNDVVYIGASDKNIDLFENQYPVPEGMAYNSYLIKDDKVAVFDTVDSRVSEVWREKLIKALGDRTPDYLIVHHLEPDHSANIGWIAQQFPNIQIVLSAKAASMLPQFFSDTKFSLLPVKDGDTLSLGSHSLSFIMAPMVHWPEVMVSFENSTHSLFSADAFGEFGAVSDDGTDDDEWANEARRYYYNICGKYGIQVSSLLRKASALDIKTIFPLHGPVLCENISYYIDRYKAWSSYTPESQGVLIAHASIHGNTAAFAERLALSLKDNGVNVKTIDITRTDVSYAVADAFDFPTIVLAASSYDAGLFPPMENFLLHLKSKNFNSRNIAVIENGSWAPTAARTMNGILDSLKNINRVEPAITIKTTPSENNEVQLEQLAKNLSEL